MKQTPSVSFVIRTKNEERHIGEVLESLKKQTNQDFEIIIVDSGSTDGTLEIVKRYDVNLITIKPEEFNYSYALNLGINAACGQYIGILSGHSVPKSNLFFERAMKHFENKNVAAVGGVQDTDESNIGKISNLFFISASDWSLFKKRTAKISNSCAFVRKDLWFEYPFDERLEQGCEDYDFALEMQARGLVSIKDPALVVKYYYDSAHHGSFKDMLPVWKKINKGIEAKARPSKSYTKIAIKS